MRAGFRWAAVLGAALMLTMLGAGEAKAQFCSSDAQCAANSRCADWFLWLKRCEFFRCNADSDCPNDRACLTGLCTRTACTTTADCPRGTCMANLCRRGGGGGPAGSPGAGGGQKCGKITENGQVRVYPACPATFQCRQGRCARPEQ